MRKVVVVADASVLSHTHRRESRSLLPQPPRHAAASRPRFESWVPPEYSVAQLLFDVVRYWRLSPTKKYELCDSSDTPLASKTRLETQSNTTPQSPNDDPFLVQDKLFELFLFYALQNMSGKALTITCYQFKALLQRATSHMRSRGEALALQPPSKCVSPSSNSRAAKPSSSIASSNSKLEFDTRVVLAFKGAVSNASGGGAGATFDEFLDALVDVAGFVLPTVSSKALAFATLTTEFVLPQFERERYAGSASTLSWTQMDTLVATPAVRALVQRFAKPVGALAATYSTTIGGAPSCRGLQFHEFAKFVHELALQSLAVSASELCDVFIRCCRVELSQQYSATTTLASLYFSSSLARSSGCRSSSSSSSGAGHPSSSSPSFDKFAKGSRRRGSAGGNFAIHGGSNGSDRGDPLTESGGALEVTCTNAMRVLSYVALVKALPLARAKEPCCRVNLTTLPLSARLAQLSIKALLQHMANHLTSKCAHPQSPGRNHDRYATKSSAEAARARNQFLHEFAKMHHEDAMGDYLSDLGRELRELVKRDASRSLPSRLPSRSDMDVDSVEPTTGSADTKDLLSNDNDDGMDFDVSLNWGDDDSDGSDSDSDANDDSSARRSLASIDPQLLQALRLRELEDLTESLDDGDEIYSFLASELQRHAQLDRRIDDTDTVAQILDMWVAAGQKYAQVLSHIDATDGSNGSDTESVKAADDSHPFAQLKANVLQRFGCSLYVLATQLLRHTTLVYAYEERFAITNARVYGVIADCWDDSRSVFTTDLAMETLSLASAKLTSACAAIEELLTLQSDDPSRHAALDSDDPSKHADSDEQCSVAPRAATAAMYAKYIECVYYRASCLAAYGDTLAHNRRCVHDYELGCQLEEELEAITSAGKSGNELHCDDEPSDGDAVLYHSTSVLSKSSRPGQFYREAHRMLRFVTAHAQQLRPRLPVIRVHVALASTQFRLATHLPRGCVAEKKLLEDALVHLAMCQKASLPAPERGAVDARKAYISAILVLRHKFFQPEGPYATKPTLDPTPSTSSHSSASHRSKTAIAAAAAPVEELISPFYRFVLAAAFKDFDVAGVGALAQPQLNELNRACGRGSVSESVLQWLLRNFDRQGDTLTENGLLQYFCWIAEADPLAFCEILDIFTSKYTETHHASITTSRPKSIAKEPKAKSLRSILFAERRQQSLSTSLPPNPSHCSAASNKTGLAECVVVLSGKMTSEACGDISATQSPSDIRLEPEVIDVLPSSANLPDELSKFCFPDDVFLCDELLPPKAFDIVLTDIKGERLYGSCLHFYEEKNPMEVLALIASVQRGKRASLPSWVSLRDIQQHKTRWRCFVPKCLCVLSSVPLFATFQTFVTQLYRLSLSAPSPGVIETFVLQLLAHIALPASNLVQTSFHLLDRACLLTGCATSNHPTFYPTEVDFTILFQCLSLENILKVYTFLLTEKKVVVCSDNCAILTPVMETLRALLHPFECQVVYIPVLPLSLLDFVSAPVPFFMGVRSDTRVDRLTADGIVVVDLDKNDVALPPNELLPSLPDVKAKKLLQALRKVAGYASSQHSKNQCGRVQSSDLAPLATFEAPEPIERDVAQLARRHDELMERWTELQTLFAGFATRMLKDVRKYCAKAASPNDPSESIAFDRRGFLSMHPSLREFSSQLFQTQLFQRFLERTVQDSGSGSSSSIGAEPEVSWRSARSMSVIWKSEPAEEVVKAPQRHVVHSPSPFAVLRSAVNASERSLAQRRPSLTTIDAFPTFNAHLFDNLLVRSTNTSSSTSTALSDGAAGSSMHVEAPLTSSTERPVDDADNATLAQTFHTGDSPARRLVSAARQRLDAV